jgi:ATP-binding protein involved in chromosome partitioning
MATPDHAAVEALLKDIVDPNTGQNLGSSKTIKKVQVEDGTVRIDAVLSYAAAGWHDAFRELLSEPLRALDGVREVHIDLRTDIASHAVQKGVNPITGVKNMIAIASGKGGVGKSTVAVNLALALAVEGARAGILDADIYGPSQPRMLGVRGKPESRDGKSLEPLIGYGLQTMSIGFLIEEETPMIWRGPMVTQALEQLLKDTRWNDLDYLVIDLPPGTGDIQLTLAQKVPVTGAIIVTTPQDIALLDARKAYKMFEKVEIPVLGVVENMSTYVCSQCGHEEHIFGEGGGRRMAEQYDVEYLGDIPLDGRIRADGDGGQPTVVADPDGPIATTYRTIARRVGARLATRRRDYTASFPNIVIQNT